MRCADRLADAIQRFGGLTFGMEQIVDLASKAVRPKRCIDRMLLIGFGDSRETHHLPFFLLKQVADKIVLMQALP